MDFVILDEFNRKGNFSIENLPYRRRFLEGGLRKVHIQEEKKELDLLRGYKISHHMTTLFQGDEATDTVKMSQLFIALLKSIAHSVIDKVDPPKTIYIDPVSCLKKRYRKGPLIKRKGKADKQNPYLPFAFHKGQKYVNTLDAVEKSKCKEITLQFTECIDLFNKHDVQTCDNRLKVGYEFISWMYLKSDILRDSDEKINRGNLLSETKEALSLTNILLTEDYKVFDISNMLYAFYNSGVSAELETLIDFYQRLLLEKESSVEEVVISV
jgi:hypothetical protein